MQPKAQLVFGGVAGREGVGIKPRGVAVIEARHAPLRAVDLAGEDLSRHAPAQAAHKRIIEPGQVSHAAGEAVEGGGVVDAFHQVGQELATRIGLHVAQVFAGDGALAFARGGDEGGQARDVRQHRACCVEAREIEHRRDQHEPVHAHPLIGLQHMGDLGRAKPAVAFSQNEFRREFAPIGLHPSADGDGERGHVAPGAPQGFAHLVAAENPAVAGACGIEKDQIAEIEPGLRVGFQRGLGRGSCGFAAHVEPPWAQRAQMQPARGIARPSVENEGHGPVACLRALLRIGDEGHVRLGRAAGGVKEADGSGVRCEFEAAAGQVELVAGGGVRGQTRQALAGWARIGGAPLGGWLALGGRGGVLRRRLLRLQGGHGERQAQGRAADPSNQCREHHGLSSDTQHSAAGRERKARVARLGGWC